MLEKTLKLLVILALIMMILPVHGQAVTTTEMEAEFMCDCGCGDMLVNCTCERSEEMRGIITGMINQGKTKSQILGLFVSQFGEVILSSPPRKGFNLVAYVVPMTGFVIGTIFAVFMVRRWKTSPMDEEDDESESGADLSDEMEERIREELKDLED